MQDIISDFVARINNSVSSNKSESRVIKSNLVVNLCKKLTRLNFFKGFREDGFYLIVEINSEKLGKLIRVSKPGKRVYAKGSDFPTIINGFGFNIITTSQGVMTHPEAIKSKVGGEVLMQAIKA
jgi:small subunit ribosomal protein S8